MSRRWGSKSYDSLILFMVLLCCAFKFSLPLRSYGSLLGFAQDDFYYYLKTAQNLSAGHGSTFDGTTLSNGYHPLYFLLLTCASFFIHSLRGVFRLLWLVDVISAASLFVMARRVFRRITADPVLTNAAALIVLLPCIATISLQMEVTLAMPLGFAFLATGFVAAAEYTPLRCAALGLLGALTMLARLDAGILICLFLVSLLLVQGMRKVLTFRNIASFSVSSLTLLLIYFALNHHYFHEWLPISGSAKQMKKGLLPDWSVLTHSFSGFSLVFLAITAAAIAVAIWLRRWLEPQEKVLCAAALLMPLVFYTLELLISDWKLWSWYLYALRFAMLAAVALVLISICRPTAPSLRISRNTIGTAWVAPVLLLMALLGLFATRYKVDPVMMNIAEEDTRLSNFAMTHPGRYAMGDRAGMFGYLSSSPLMQTEGLMMDRQYLQHIRHEDDLLTTLRKYKVDYYVQYVFDEDRSERIKDGCLNAQEPSIAGKNALRMRSSLCFNPVATFLSEGGRLYLFDLRQ